MPVVEKQVLAPATYWVRQSNPEGGAARRVPVTFTQDDVKHFARSGKAMIAAGLPIRFPLEHQAYADPIDDDDRKAKDVLYNKGFVRDYRLDSGDGSLWASIDVPDGDFARRLETGEIPYVSPKILPSFMDGTGRIWKNVIGHVCATPLPVDHTQKPFGSAPAGELMPVALSLLDYQMKNDQPILLSLADRVDPVEMGAGMFPEEEDRDGQGTQNDDSSDDDSDLDESPIEDEADESDAGTKARQFEQAKQLLETKKGVKFPPHTTEENFLEHLVVALTQHDDEGDEEDGLSDEDMDEGNQNYLDSGANMPQEETATVQMSALTERVKKAEARAAAAEKRAAKQEFSAIKRELRSHVERGALAPDRATKLIKELEPLQLSLLNDKSPIAIRAKTILECARANPNDAVAPMSRLSDGSGGRSVQMSHGDATEEEMPSWGFTEESVKKREADQKATIDELVAMASGAAR